MMTLAKELTTRIVIITIFYSIISFIIIERHKSTLGNLEISVPLFFVTFGVVTLINILFCLRKYHVWSSKK